MASTDLVFVAPLVAASNDLVFGAIRTGIVALVATVPAPTLSVSLHAEAPSATGVVVSYVVPAPVLYAFAGYDNVTPNRMHSTTAAAWQEGDTLAVAARSALQGADPLPVYRNAAWGIADPLRHFARVSSQAAERSERPATGNWQEAPPVSNSYESSNQDLARTKTEGAYWWANAIHAGADVFGGWQDRIRAPRPDTASRWQIAVPASVSRRAFAGAGVARPHTHTGRWQDAMRPPPGYWAIPLPPLPVERCYYPPFGNAVGLVFREAHSGTPHLLFVCNRLAEDVATAIIPVRRVYVVLNDVRLFRVDGNIELPVEAFSLSADVDSWTFGFTATLPASALANVEPAAFGSPVEVDASINGTHFRLLVERIGRERTFGRSRITVSGRGISAMLADPYSPVLPFSNTQERTAQQLVNDSLTTNGVPLGWSVDWRITDWLVPAGVFSHQGRYVDAVNAIVGAAGAYVQPHPTAKTLIVLPRYPVAPWAFGTATPDLELPSAAVEQDGISWQEFPEYNAVYVGGAADGILAQVKRTGSAGDKPAPMIVDPLITATAAARQRGVAVLGKTGRIATVSLTMPVLPESGIVQPGKLIRYMDGIVPRLGISRSVQVQTEFAKVRQTIEVEAHA